ncbi:Ig-like domain-containing protein [Candidatus Omnitrophota bacterium]
MVERLIKTWQIYFIFIGIIFCAAHPLHADEHLKEKAVQFFIRFDGDGICNTPKEAVVFTLDSYGLIDTSFEGVRKVSISVKEIGGKKLNSFKPLPEELEFRKGKASFFIEESEPETLEFTILEGKNKSPFPARLTFRKKSIPQRLEIKLSPRGNINEPQKASVTVLDKDGKIAVDYNRKGFNIVVEESGLVDRSFTLDPESLNISKGKASFSITDSEEDEELILRLVDPKGRFKPIEAGITFFIPDKEPPEIIDLKMETLAFVEITFSEELDDGSATEASNYKVVSSDTQTPRSVEFHGDRVILELDDLLRSFTEMYVEVRDLKDLAGNEIERDARSPNYSVPYSPINLVTDASSNPSGLGTAVSISIIARCLSGRVTQFINAQFEVDVTEEVSDDSFEVSSQGVQMTKGEGKFTISNSTAEKLTVTIRDPDGEVTSSSIELEFI